MNNCSFTDRKFGDLTLFPCLANSVGFVTNRFVDSRLSLLSLNIVCEPACPQRIGRIHLIATGACDA